jgi:hypothetical protein
MMKLQITTGRETPGFVPVTSKTLSTARNANQHRSEPLCIGAPTESPRMKSRSMRIKAFTCAAMLAALGTVEIFATPPPSSAFTYQGRLNDGGAPANGNYDMIFNLYDAPTNGNVLGSYSIFSAVPVGDGLFTLELNSNGEFGPNAFNGQARWLQIGVRTNNNNAANPWVYLNPRQALDPTPQAMFAMNAGNAMNASFAANVADGSISSAKLAPGAVQAGNLAPGAVAWSSIAGIPAGFADGVDNNTTYAAGPGLALSGTNNQLSVNFAGTGAANTAARSDHTHFGANWGGTTAFGVGLSVTNGAANGAGLYGQQGTGSGFPYVFGNNAGVWGEASQGSGVYGASATFRGVQGISLGTQGSGVYGTALSSTGTNYGVYGESASADGVGVLAKGSGSSGTALRVSSGAIRVTGAGPGSATPAFVHVVTVSNMDTNGFYTVIDNPFCNNDPNAMLLVTPNWGVISDYSASSTVSVLYDDGNSNLHLATNRWVLYVTDANQLLWPGDRYNVLVIKP